MKTILVLVLVAACNLAFADAQELDFNSLVKVAFEKSPVAAKIDAALADRIAEAFSKGVRANPELRYSFDNPTSGRSTDHDVVNISISQSLRASDFGARAALSSAIEKTGDLDKQIAIYQFVQDLGVLYARAWQFQEYASLLKDARARASRFLRKVAEGANRGVLSEGDAEVFRAEQKIVEADGVAAQGELAETMAELTRLTGVVTDGKRLQRLDNSIPVTKEDLVRLSLESALPIQLRVGLLRDLADKQLEVSRFDSIPPISPSFGYARQEDGVEQYTVGISVHLPFFDRNQGERFRARGARSAALQELRYLTSEALVNEIQLKFEAVKSLERQVELYETGVIPAKKRAVEAYYRQFEAGIGSSFQLWQAFRELNASQLRGIELVTVLAAKRAQLNALIGKQF